MTSKLKLIILGAIVALMTLPALSEAQAVVQPGSEVGAFFFSGGHSGGHYRHHRQNYRYYNSQPYYDNYYYDNSGYYPYYYNNDPYYYRGNGMNFRIRL